jgi:hypothetical protein
VADSALNPVAALAATNPTTTGTDIWANALKEFIAAKQTEISLDGQGTTTTTTNPVLIPTVGQESRTSSPIEPCPTAIPDTIPVTITDHGQMESVDMGLFHWFMILVRQRVFLNLVQVLLHVLFF